MSTQTIRSIPEMVRTRLPELMALCQEFGVVRMELFGSATTDRFDPATSDLDFLIEFDVEYDLGPWMKKFFELESRLVELFGRDVDLVFGSNIRNPHLRASIDANRMLVYAA